MYTIGMLTVIILAALGLIWIISGVYLGIDNVMKKIKRGSRD